MFRDLPYHLDRRRAHPEGPPADLTAWSHVMAATVHVDDGARAGFYVKYARLIANICLEARRDPAFRDLAMMLRGPEGGGTYNSRADAWPTGYALTRLAATRVALWIKGRALAASVVGVSPAASELEAAAALLVARCGDERPLRSA